MAHRLALVKNSSELRKISSSFFHLCTTMLTTGVLDNNLNSQMVFFKSLLFYGTIQSNVQIVKQHNDKAGTGNSLGNHFFSC